MSRASRKAPSGRTRRDAVADEVLEALGRLLESGSPFATLGVQQICEEAGVARSAFYLNFANKSAALVRLVQVATEELFDASVAWIESDPEAGFERLVETQAHTIRVWRRHAPVIAAYFSAAQSEPELSLFWERQVQAMIEAGQLGGRVGRHLDPAITAGMLVRGAERLTAHHVATQPVARDGAFARGVAGTIWALVGESGQS
jgi:TetR/AcrR family transcriptional regulator, ethionamide resistance regulator